ncbi:MAG: outer membrane beta-barrel protein [Saprospiraceae bacterium]|nr:outer membrane beta-barrel protein [Saprospiraceae bacterium]
MTTRIRITLSWIWLLFSSPMFTQVTHPDLSDTTSASKPNPLTIGGYLDLYYGWQSGPDSQKDMPYFVSMASNKELTVNLAYLDLKYSTEDLRVHLVPGFGTYMQANYANEDAGFKNLVEASAGVALSKKKGIWLDAGILGSPYTNESAISKDHLMYTRSLAPEYVPYYLSGVKLTMPISTKVTAYLYLLNGWQQIKDNNANLAFGSQLEYRPDDQNLINWNTYIGDESSPSNLQIWHPLLY